MTPSITGDPSGLGDQSICANLSSPRRPNVEETSSWSSDRMFTTNRPAFSIPFHEPEVFIGQNSTNGGSSDRAENDWQAKPTGLSSSTAVMTVIPVQNCPSASRSSRLLKDWPSGLSSVLLMWVVLPGLSARELSARPSLGGYL